MKYGKNIIPVPEIAEAFPDLTLPQFRLLGFCAYYGQDVRATWAMNYYDGVFRIRGQASQKDIAVLEKLGYLSNGQVRQEDYFRIVIPLIKHFPEWVSVFEKRQRPSDVLVYVWKLAKCLADGNYRNALLLKYPTGTGVWKYFSAIVFSPEYGDLLQILPQRDVDKVLGYALGKGMEDESLRSSAAKRNGPEEASDRKDSGDSSGRNLLSDIRSKAVTWLDRPEEILGRADAYEYFISGKLQDAQQLQDPQELPDDQQHQAPQQLQDDHQPQDAQAAEVSVSLLMNSGEESFWTIGVEAVGLLLKGKLADALEAFFRARNMLPVECDNVFPDRLLTWFYALCLVKDIRKYNGRRSSAALEALKKSPRFKFEPLHDPSRILLTYMDSKEAKCRDYVVGEVKKILQPGLSRLGRMMSLAVLKYFQVPEETISSMLPESSDTPQTQIFKNELSDYIPMSSSEKSRLRTVFGGPGVLSTVARKEDWEMALDGLSDFVSAEKEETEVQTRIIYFLNDRWITSILEQSRKAGETEWTKERLLSRSVFVKGGYESMDVLDLKLAQAIGNKVIDRPDADVLIPIMAGTDRVFTGQHYRQPYTQLQVRTEAPFVGFSLSDGMIKVTSNVNRSSDGKVPAAVTRQNGEEYIHIKINPIQRDILGKLLEVGSFPASALPAIQRTINSLDGVLEVKSELSGLAVIPNLRGSVRMALRISPLKDKENVYSLDIASAPHEEGNLRCVPGHGTEDVYDDSTGEALFVRRDLQAEFDNYTELFEYLSEEVGLEFENEFRAVIYDSESLLKVLTWAFDHRDKSFVEWPEGRALRFRGDVKSSDVDISVTSGVNWFSVEGEVGIGKDKYDLMQVLQAMRESNIKGFIKLGDKDYVRMTNALRRHLEALDEMLCGRAGKEKVVPVYRVGQLAEVLSDEDGLRGRTDDGYKALVKRIEDAYGSEPEIPPELRAELRDYQKEGYSWMKRLDAWGAGSCLADDMGLGKTLQSLAFILSKADQGPSLVVAPKSVVPNWDIEAARFAPTLKVTVLNNVSNREDVIAFAGPGDLILATYGVLVSENKALTAKKWNVICLDEAHQIKNRNTRVSAAAMALEGSSRIILTGTPIQNHLGELWNLFQFINPGLLGQWSDFKAHYMVGELDERRQKSLRDLIQPFILRRTKEEVLDELPEKIICEKMVELSPEEMQLYEAMRMYVEDRINTDGSGKREHREEAVKIDFFAELTNLRLAALSPSLVYNDWTRPSSKTEALMSLLDEISSVESNQVVVFSQFTSYLAQIRAILDRRRIRYLYLDGQTDLDERREVVENFQNGDCPLLLASLKAGGLGLNLTAANYVILLDPWWNPAIESQAMDRAHRLGQKRNVTVIRLIAQHTIEEKILRLHESKRQLSDEMLAGTAFSAKLTMEDVLEMVSPFK